MATLPFLQAGIVFDQALAETVFFVCPE